MSGCIARSKVGFGVLDMTMHSHGLKHVRLSLSHRMQLALL